MINRAWIVLLLPACSAAPDFYKQVLEPGDAVIGVFEDRAVVALADARGVAEIEIGAVAIGVIRKRDVRDLEGRPLANLDGLTADLEGDTGCGCRVPPVGTQQIIAPGDRCALPAMAELGATAAYADPQLLASPRSKLRVTWPGTCACPRLPFSERSSVSVCPLGEDAERMKPVATVLSGDGTITVISRMMAVEIAPDGARHETRIEPAAGNIKGVIALPHGGAVIVGDVVALTVSSQNSEYIYVPPRGAGPARRLDNFPTKYDLVGVYNAPSGDAWIYGRLPGRINHALLARCRIGDDVDAGFCIETLVMPSPDCPQHRTEFKIVTMTELEGGELMAMTEASELFFVRNDEAICVTARVEGPTLGGGEIYGFRGGHLASIGRRVLACLVGNDRSTPVVEVMTATVGPIVQGLPLILTWRPVHEEIDGDQTCPSESFIDPREPDRAVMQRRLRDDVYTQLRITRSSTTVEIISPRTYYPELDAPIADVATSSGTMVLSTTTGETWRRRTSDAMFSRVTRFPRALGGAPTAILPVEGGFRVYTGSSNTIQVRSGPTCSATTISIPEVATMSALGEEDDVVTQLGDRVLLFGRRGGAAMMIVRDFSDRLLSTVPLEGNARVVSAAEIMPGAWAAFVRDDGSVWATDGGAPVLLDDRGGWRFISARPGVGWLASDSDVGRVVVRAGGGGLEVETDLMSRIDTSAFDTLNHRGVVPRITAIRAFCDGRAMVAYRDNLDGLALSVWLIAPVAGRLTMVPYEELRPETSWPRVRQQVLAIGGDSAAPLLVYASDPDDVLQVEDNDGLHTPGAQTSALPFSDLAGFGGDGRDVLIGGSYLRFARVLIRED